MKIMKRLALASLLVSSLGAQATELDDLLTASAAIVDQINTGILMSGAAQGYAYTGAGISNGTLAGTSHISAAQVTAYNEALTGMTTYLPYGSAQQYLEDQAATELDAMNDAIGEFTAVVVDMLAVQEISEMATAAATPDEEAALQD